MSIVSIRNHFHVDAEDYFLVVKNKGKEFEWVSRMQLSNENRFTDQDKKVVDHYCTQNQLEPLEPEIPLFHHFESFDFLPPPDSPSHQTELKKRCCGSCLIL
jgi:hypothetical protein